MMQRRPAMPSPPARCCGLEVFWLSDHIIVLFLDKVKGIFEAIFL
jgi:hypothetical protein